MEVKMKKSSYSEDSLPLPPPSSSEPPEESEPSPPEEPDTGDRGGNMFVIPVTFAKEHRAMFAHCRVVSPQSPLGRIIGVIVMFAGIGIAVTLVTAIAQGRVQRMQERLMSKTAGKAKALANETKATIKDNVEGIEKLTEEDFDGLVIMMKSLRLTLLEESKNVYKCPRCGSDYRSKPKFCSDCGFALT
jgi:hypothetical protein